MAGDLVVFLAAQQAFTDRVHAVDGRQWQAGTPDEQWDVADLVAHLVHEHLWAPPLLHGLELEAAAGAVDDARAASGDGADLSKAWDEAAAGSADAFAEAGALDRTVHLTRGATSARRYLEEMVFDLVVHSWDLGTAIGYAEPLPKGIVEPVYAQAKDFGDLSASGMFDAPVPVPDDASTLDKLVALTGRDPS